MISSLPIEIIQLIIEQVGDTDTLDKLCEATRFVGPLFHVALSRRWKEVQILEHHFLVAPHDCDRPEHSSTEPRKLLHALLEPATQGLPPIASHVRVLTIDLRFHCTPNLYGEPYEDDFECLEDVTYEDIDYSLSLLIPNLCSLRQLNLDGPLYQGQLERITQLQSIQILKIRQNSTSWPLLRRGHGRFNGGSDLCLRWDSLAKLTRLCHLEIGEVVPDEAASLGNALVQLDALRKLVVTASHNKGTEGSQIAWYGNKPGGLHHFVKVIFESHDASRPRALLPPNLVSLALIADFVKENGLVGPARTDVLTPLQAPQEIYLDYLDPRLINAVLSAHTLSNLSSVWLSARNLWLDLRWKQDYIVSLFQDHPSLDQISLLDPWSLYGLPSWISNTSFIAEDLVLGNREYDWHLNEPSPTIIEDLYGPGSHFGFDVTVDSSRDPSSWCDSVQRVLIDHVSFLTDDAFFETLTLEKWPKLRLLICRPWLGYNVIEPWKRQGGVSWGLLDEDQPNPKEAAGAAELLAEQIVTHGLPTLQVLVLGSYWFWISGVGGCTPRALHFLDARSDPIEAPLMSESLSQHDWNFLLDTSRGHTQDQYRQAGIRETDMVNLKMQRRNYLTLYRKHKEDTANHQMNQRRGRSFGQGTTVLNCPVWQWFC